MTASSLISIGTSNNNFKSKDTLPSENNNMLQIDSVPSVSKSSVPMGSQAAFMFTSPHLQ